MLGKLHCYVSKNEIRTFPNSIHKDKLKKWITNLNVKPETIKLLEENISRTLFDINHSKIFYGSSLRVMNTKIRKWDLIKLKNFCTMKKL